MQGDPVDVVLQDVGLVHHRRAHVGQDGAGLDAVDPYVVGPEDASERLGEHRDAAFGCAIGGLERRPYVRRDGADANDGSAVTLGDHLFGGLGRHNPGTPQIGVAQQVPLLEGRLVPRHERVDGRVRHQVVDLAGALGDRVDHVHDLLWLAHVGNDLEALAAGIGDLAQGRRGVACGPLVNRDQGSF